MSEQPVVTLVQAGVNGGDPQIVVEFTETSAAMTYIDTLDEKTKAMLSQFVNVLEDD